jgi:hypothetical protein
MSELTQCDDCCKPNNLPTSKETRGSTRTRRGINLEATENKENVKAFFAPQPFQLHRTHLFPEDSRNVIGVASSIAAQVVFLHHKACTTHCMRLLASLKQPDAQTGYYSHGVIVNGLPILGPMKIIAPPDTDKSNIRALPEKVFDANGVATLVGFRTKTRDRQPMPLFIEYNDTNAVIGLTVLRDPAASVFLKNVQESGLYKNFTSTGEITETEVAVIISLLTTDTGVLTGRNHISLTLFYWLLFIYVYLHLRCSYRDTDGCD